MGAALLLVRHLIWCADQIRYLPVRGRDQPLRRPWDLMACGWLVGIPAGGQARMGNGMPPCRTGKAPRQTGAWRLVWAGLAGR